jgi:hypothetical protein
MSRPDKVYVVLQVGWEYNDEDFYPVVQEENEGAQGVPVKAFRSREAAEAYRQERERDARAGCNPFTYCSDEEALYDLNEESLEQLRRDLSAEVLPPTGGLWHQLGAWWDENGAALPQALQDHAWDTLYRVPFFEVIELKVSA